MDEQRGSLSGGAVEGLGETLGALVSKVDAWRQQRAAIIAELQRLSGLTNALLQELGGAEPVADRPASRGGGRPKGFKASAETRAKLRAAWRRRKAEAGGAKRTMSPEAKARISAAQRKRWAEAKRGN